MTRFGPVLLVALFPLALCAEDKKEEKKGITFTSKEGKFSVALPDKPTEKTSQLKVGTMEAELHMFLLDQKDRAYIVSYNDYPAGSADADTNKVLQAVIDGSAKSSKGKVVSNEKIKIGKKEYPGRDVRIEFGGEKKMIYRAQVYLVGARLYQVVALGPDEFTKSKDVDEYFKSFAIEE
jgi:hypothetical protein